jgi:hypothetical protein
MGLAELPVSFKGAAVKASLIGPLPKLQRD